MFYLPSWHTETEFHLASDQHVVLSTIKTCIHAFSQTRALWVLTLKILMDCSIHIDTISIEQSPFVFFEVACYNVFYKKMSLKIVFIIANSADTDKMPSLLGFHQSLHCLHTNLFISTRMKRIKQESKYN